MSEDLTTGLAAAAARRQPKNRGDFDKTGDAGFSRPKAKPSMR
jgi:hypothetical protein